MTRKYRIEELYTAGWEMVGPTDHNLTKDEAKKRIQQYLEKGHNPQYIRAIPE